MNHRLAFRPWCGILVLSILLVGLPHHASARDMEPKPGGPAPLLTGQSVAGKAVDIATLHGQVIIIQFAGTDHQRSLEEVTRLAALLHDTKIAAVKPVWLLILSPTSNPADLPALKPNDQKPIIIHDSTRQIFGQYDIIVLPTIVVVDERGIVAYALPGPVVQFEPDMSAAVLFAAGQLTREQLDETLHPGTGTDQRNREKAQHLALLAQRMIERDMADSAVDLLEQAVNIDPECFTARLGLGEIYLRTNRYGEAATQFKKALAQNDLSINASLGLAAALIAMKPEAEAGADIPLQKAERIIDDILKRNPSNARGHYLMGLTLERQGKNDEARAEYLKSVELLLEENGIWHQ